MFTKFGSYVGNGNTDGNFIYCGFKPKYVLIKSTTGAYNWTLIDTARSTYNVSNAAMYVNASTSETTIGALAMDVV